MLFYPRHTWIQPILRVSSPSKIHVGHAKNKQEDVHRMNFFKNVNKWFYAFVVAAVLLVAAVVIAVVLGVGSQGKTPDTNAPTEGAETGIYYYDLEMGELQLALSGGNKFALTGPGYNTSGEYTVNEGEIILDFYKDEEGTATATLDGDTLTLTLGDAVMTFRKKVSFTVSYNTNGGGVVGDAQVVNGKPAPKPADPIKDGFVFLGWYADESLTTPFDFTATLIYADTMLYARWAEVIPGAPEYTVHFDPGYEGAEAIPDGTTIGGRLIGVVTPKRPGYVFNGWFTSMYGDGEKLTAEFTEDTVLTADTTLYAVWSPEGDKLPSPKVTVTGTSVKWSAVVGASAYKLKVTAPDGSVLYDETLGSTTKNVDFSKFDAGDYVIEVFAVANKAENSSDAAVRYFRNKALDRVTSFTVIDGTLIFNAVRNAEKYLITIECGNAGHNHTNLDNGRSTNYYFGNCTMKQGGIENYEIIATFKGSELEYMKCAHPFIDRTSLVIVGNHVTLESGTGCVHTAPGHGVDDFEVCRKYDELDIVVPVDHKGVLTDEAGQFSGLTTDEAKKKQADCMRNTMKNYYANMDEETKKHMHDIHSKISKDAWSRGCFNTERWKNASNKRKEFLHSEEMEKLTTEGVRRYWSNLSDEDRNWRASISKQNAIKGREKTIGRKIFAKS